MTPTLTDEQVVRLLAERCNFTQEQVTSWMDSQEAIRAHQCAEIDDDTYMKRSYYAGEPVPPYLTSRDALAPVLEGLSTEEWEHFCRSLFYLHDDLASVSKLRSYRKLLTLPARDLAHAVASVLVATKEATK